MDHDQEWYDAQEEAIAWGDSWDGDDWQPRSTSMDD